jgi:hypothetical protein
MCCARQILDWSDFVSQIFSYQVEKSGTEFNDLLMRESLTFQLAVEALGHRFVAVYVEFF